MIDPEIKLTGTYIMKEMGPTIGDVFRQALAYQKEFGELKRLLSPGADQVIAPPDDHKFKTLLADIIDFRKDCVGTGLLFTTISHRLDELIKRHSI